ncbi:MAG: family 43 glycosylhydrolase [Armatimonadetes bacterium]|nr:family 43 glycosylhydrolase [Armatimonadota bacterium]
MVPTYTNPVVARSFPDPFVLKFNGFYYAYGTGDAGDGRALKLMSSPDLIHWEWHGGILAPLPNTVAEDYWAPEVAYYNGTFYLYYAVTPQGTIAHHLRVATADHPLGPFQDAGVDLTPRELFAIDAHPFQDEDGAWYLFYARDWLTGPRAGTGLAVDRMLDFKRLAGQPERVLRPFAEWQVFEYQRSEKWGLDWYTVEAPFVVQRRGAYICFYSGGRWENPAYGVGSLTSPQIIGRDGLDAPDWEHRGDEQGATVLRTSGEWAIGPGHNCVVRAPNNAHDYLIYHAWDATQSARMPRVKRLEWNLVSPVCEEPTVEPQPVPPPPALMDRFEEEGPALGEEWEQREGLWQREGGAAHAAPGVSGCLALAAYPPSRYLLFEVNLCAPPAKGRLGALMEADAAHAIYAWVDLARRELRLEGRAGNGPLKAAAAPLPPGFRPDVWHRLLLWRNAAAFVAQLDGFPRVSLHAALPPTRAGLIAEEQAASFTGVALTPHFRDEFLGGDGGGWEYRGGHWEMADGWLSQADATAEHARAEKGEPLAALDASVSVRPGPGEGRCGILLAHERQPTASAVWLAPNGAALNVDLVLLGAEEPHAERVLAPKLTEPHGFHHIRIVRQGGRDMVYANGREVGSLPSRGAAARLALVTERRAADFTGASVTWLPPR